MDLASIARALGGEVSSGQVLAPASGHSSRDRSLSIKISPAAPGGIVVHLFTAGDVLAEKDRVLDALGIGRDTERRRTLRAAPTPAERPALARSPTPEEQDRTARAVALWHEARPPWGTPVEAYLTRARGLTLFDAMAGSVRYHPSCPFAGPHRTPAMVCLVRDVVTNTPKAIHRTALSLDGSKREVGGHDRQSLGPVAGGAIKLTPDEDVTTCLGVGEGVESALSLRLLPEFGASPVWSLISAGGIERLPVLAGIEALWIAVDHDEAGIRASEACAGRWADAGAESFLAKPQAARTDLNDVFKARTNG